MIQSTIKLKYESRNQSKESKILIELKETSVENGRKNFEVIDYTISDEGVKSFRDSKPYFQTKEQIDQLDAYLDANVDFGDMGKFEKEKLKLQLGLLYFVQNDFCDDEHTETIYGSIPSNWELC
jgi:hypothetical protein